MKRREFLIVLSLSALTPIAAIAAGGKKRKKLPKAWTRLSPEEQASVLKQWEKFKALPAEQQAQLKQAFRRWQKLSPEKQKRLRAGMERWTSLTPEVQTHLRSRYSEWNNLTIRERRQRRDSLMRERDHHHGI